MRTIKPTGAIDIETIEVIFIFHTEKAVLIETLDGQEKWLPKSMLLSDHEYSSLERGEHFNIRMERSYAIKKEML